MFFKRLELFGFKSFAEKTRFDFEAGVTAIVGPNGCGKTNFVDSIKWVLGEQSVRSLRGSSMEDVVFHGADNMSAVGFAEVSLTIANQQNLLPLDYEEITITRRIFRSGESEYLINKIPVRLKDITELLMGTGLGMHSYSLMEQGKVDQVLSSKPEERRSIFEEASGITRYKSKKEEALRKLERTGENLQRLGDIIVEVKRQIKSIERQVNKAQRYKQEFEKLKEYEINVARYKSRNLRKEKEQLQSQANTLQKEEACLSSKMDSKAHSLEKAREQLSCLEESISQIRAQSYEAVTAIKAAENKISLNQERVEELAMRTEELKGQIQNFEQKITATGEQVKAARKRIENVEQEKQAKASLVQEKQSCINQILAAIKEAQKKVSTDKAQEVEIITQQSKLRNALTKLEANLANFNARLRRLNVEKERTQGELDEIEERHKVANSEIELLSSQLKQATKEIWDLKSNLNIKLEKKQELDSRLEDISRQQTLLQSRLSFLTEITRKYEGFSRGVKSVLSAMDEGRLKIDGFYGVVANLIEVSPQYQMAIEMALGENAQGLVVESSQAASEAINYLEAKDAGRASLICLDGLRPADSKNIKLQGAEGPALEFVKTEPKYQKLIAGLLSNTFIVRDREIARRIIEDRGSGIKLVTLDGLILSRSSMVGGSLPKNLNSSLLGRQEKIAQTEQELERIKQAKAEIESSKARHESEIKEVSGLIQEKEPDLNKLKIQSANKETERVNIEAEKKRLADEVSLLTLELDEANEEMEQVSLEQQKLNQQLQSQQAREKELQDSIQAHLNLITEKNQDKENTLVEITRAKAESLGLERETEDAQRRLQMLVDSQTEQKQAQETRRQEIETATTKTEELRQEMSELQLKAKELSQTKISVEEKLNETMRKRQGLSATIQNLEGHSRVDQKGLDEVRAKRANMQLKLTELNYKQDSLKERLQQAYQVVLEDAGEQDLEVSAPDASLFEEINRLKAKLEGLGPVNLVAIEENDQLQQRHSFLISQQEDLLSAQESLRRAITQINRTARTVFAETFQKIQVGFKEYFRILFGGGDARLVLLDENNILESGIEIVVRPPGKKLQNISLLSGGEKALTAIALLFAIFKVKPSPFCILDEVDAPLDEANVERFTNLLGEFIKTSQFIIITHNKKTINMADIMYGITMQKSGISKIVSVKLTHGGEREAPVQETVPVVSKTVS